MRGSRAVAAIALSLSVALAGLNPVTGAAGQPSAPSGAAAADAPASWTPWVMTSADQFRLGPPPKRSSRSTKRDLKQLRRLQKKRTPKIERRVENWNSGAVVLRWTDTALELITKYKQRPPFAARQLVLLHTALHDAVIAASDSRAAHQRKAPWKVDRRIDPLFKPSGTSYPPLEAAMAGAAETMLTYLFPLEDPKTFDRLADKALKTRLWAGVNYKSDLTRDARWAERSRRCSSHVVRATVTRTRWSRTRAPLARSIGR